MAVNKKINEQEIASLGASLREIEKKFLKQGKKEGVNRIWFQGGEPYFDIFLELNDDEITWFQFTLRGQSLSWDKKLSTWQTGQTNEMKSDDVSFYAASKTIESDMQIDWEFVNFVKSILETRKEEATFRKILALFPVS
ncbi:hypothetical protein [Calothrix sp. 336/3]|uniref:hypothetical protein n=1 Tax=Calothrix sp. 336/3 TaxID=1337936 RepID=UPI0004E3E3A7|nr:hypothetical protein [Calothrix sp. 336/3]AKG23474.1 hypothetical protein IJ00_21295 [Calothrix sp. 336/3]